MNQPGPSGNSRKRKRVALNASTNETILSQWLEAELERDFSDVDYEEVDPDFCLQSNHDSASEQSEDEKTQISQHKDHQAVQLRCKIRFYLQYSHKIIYTQNPKWPLEFFFRLLDLSGVNAFVLYRQCADVSDI